MLQVRRCVKLNAPDNGYIKCSGDGNNYGATCEFSCIGGYELQGSPARVCQYNLGWSGVEPTCARKWVFHHFARRAARATLLLAVRIWEGSVVWNTAANFSAPEVRNNIFVTSANWHLQLKCQLWLLFPRMMTVPHNWLCVLDQSSVENLTFWSQSILQARTA